MTPHDSLCWCMRSWNFHSLRKLWWCHMALSCAVVVFYFSSSGLIHLKWNFVPFASLFLSLTPAPGNHVSSLSFPWPPVSLLLIQWHPIKKEKSSCYLQPAWVAGHPQRWRGWCRSHGSEHTVLGDISPGLRIPKGHPWGVGCACVTLEACTRFLVL